MAQAKRLFPTLTPNRYRLHLDIDTEGFTYTAEEQLEFTLADPSTHLTLHSVGLKIGDIHVDGNAPVSMEESVEEQTVTLKFAHELTAGEHQLSATLSRDIPETLHGCYRSSYERDGKTKWLITTQFEAVHAREVFLCVDEPSAKAIFELTLVVPGDKTVISNTNSANEQPAGKGRKKVQFAATPKMSTYLLAFLVGEFEFVEAKTKEGVAVRVYGMPGTKSQLGFALETGVRALSFYSDYFGIPYPLPKLDMIAVPDFAAGAMENWGAVTYREVSLLLDPHKTTLAHKQRVAVVVTHELAHQWFGDLVTMSWWEDLWLNEGFASWMEVFAKDALFPEWDSWTEYVASDVSEAMSMDALVNTHPIQVEVHNPNELDEIFDAVSYSKGSSIINMLHHYLGAEAFKKGMHLYLKRHAYGNSTTHDLWLALGEASGKPVDEVMTAWTSQPGFPILSYDNGNITQERFYASPSEAKTAKGGQMWPIPLSVLTDGGKEINVGLVKDTSQELPDEVVASGWFKPNPGQTAFARSLYSQGMVEALTGPLKKRTLAATDRFGVVDDVFAATEAGKLGSLAALKLVESLKDETNYVVWQGVTGGFMHLLAVCEDETIRAGLERFGRDLVSSNVQRLGWDPKIDEPAFDELMRPLVLQQAVRFDEPTAIKHALTLFKRWVDGHDIHPDTRSVVLYAAARNGGPREYEAMKSRYLTETIPQLKMQLLGTMGRFRNKTVIDDYLRFALSSDVRPQDTFYAVAYGFANRDARIATWQWVKDSWQTFETRYGAGGHMLERFPLYAGSGFATHAMAREIDDFFGKIKITAIKRPTAQAVEAVELKADWFDRDKADLAKFVAQTAKN